MGIFERHKRRQFERMIKPFARPLFQAALRLTRQSEGAEDLTQDTLIRAYERFALFKPGTNFRAWLFTILMHTYLNDCDRARRRPLTTSMDGIGEDGTTWDLPSQDTGNHPELALLANALDEDIQAALDALPDEFRLAILLVDMEEMSYQEAAEALQVPIGTVRSRVSRGRAALRQQLQRSYGSRPS